jgi:hypothetical protein
MPVRNLEESPLAPEDLRKIEKSFVVKSPSSTSSSANVRLRNVKPEQRQQCASCTRWLTKIERGIGLHKDFEGQKVNFKFLSRHSEVCESFLRGKCIHETEIDSWLDYSEHRNIKKGNKIVSLIGTYCGLSGHVIDIESRPSGKVSLRVEMTYQSKVVYPWILADNVKIIREEV